jgi:hypothetical protein
MADPETTNGVVFHYIKGSGFRTLHVDGALGVTAPSGNVHCSVYSERPAIPKIIRHEIDAEGKLSDECEIIDGKDGYVRELEADLVMSASVARALAKWLNDAADQIEAGESE